MVWGTPKSHQRRSVSLPDFLADKLKQHIAGLWPEDDLDSAPVVGTDFPLTFTSPPEPNH